jgi:hypothetical protein
VVQTEALVEHQRLDKLRVGLRSPLRLAGEQFVPQDQTCPSREAPQGKATTEASASPRHVAQTSRGHSFEGPTPPALTARAGVDFLNVTYHARAQAVDVWQAVDGECGQDAYVADGIVFCESIVTGFFILRSHTTPFVIESVTPFPRRPNSARSVHPQRLHRIAKSNGLKPWR